jgi:hypothetical protein
MLEQQRDRGRARGQSGELPHHKLLQEIAEELGHSLEVLADHYAHVISEYAGKGKIDPETLIREARKRAAGGDVSRRTGRQMDAKSANNGGE